MFFFFFCIPDPERRNGDVKFWTRRVQHEENLRSLFADTYMRRTFKNPTGVWRWFPTHSFVGPTQSMAAVGFGVQTNVHGRENVHVARIGCPIGVRNLSARQKHNRCRPLAVFFFQVFSGISHDRPSPPACYGF